MVSGERQPRSVSSSDFLRNKKTVGWVPENGGRGTLTLIVTCTFTIFLCTWVVIHPRVTTRPLLRNLHKMCLFLKTMIAPELIAVEALQEWSQARNTVQRCAVYTNGEMKMMQAFYIGMLALRYRSVDSDNIMWSNQYEWLLRENLISWRDHVSWGLLRDDILDKNKSDGVVKLAALIQVLWFLAQCLMRKAHRLPLSQYECMTISYIPLFAVTYYLWWVKPKDIMAATIVDLPIMNDQQRNTFESLAVSNMFDSDKTEQNRFGIIWALTPRIFEKEARDQAMANARQQNGSCCS